MVKTIRNPLSGKRPRRSITSYGCWMLAAVFVVLVFSAFSWMTRLAVTSTVSSMRRQPQRRGPSLQESGDAIARIRQEFQTRYGKYASSMYSKAVQEFGDLQSTAERLLRAASANEPFVLGFAGYSVTVGRGNYFHESFPFVLERLLKPLLRETLDVSIVVRNGAIGGIPSFPYAFCFEHFLGNDLDVLSWDYSMNEGRGASVLESYLRHSQQQPRRPMMILLDTNAQRCNLLKEYTDNHWLSAGLCVGKAKEALPDKFDTSLPGLQHWDEFGAPASCPGRGSWHPKKMEHELIGWLMSLYFVKAVELALQLQQQHDDWRDRYGPEVHSVLTPQFGAPKGAASNTQSVQNLLYGHEANGVYELHDISCRTNFLPASDNDKVLPSIVVSGLAAGATADNIMSPRSDREYQEGWVLDVSKVERDTKIKVEKCGGLGYVDMKIALYGIPESGTLRLWLPLEGHAHDDHDHGDDEDATHVFDEIVICEANDKRGDAACQLDRDVEYTVGGVGVVSPSMVKGAGEYLKRQTCVSLGVPQGAKLVKLGQVESEDGRAIGAEVKRRLSGHATPSDDHLGLVVDIRARPNVKRKEGACCISHVVWEQH